MPRYGPNKPGFSGRHGPAGWQAKLGRRQNSFTMQVEGIVNKTDLKLLAVARQSIQKVVDDAQLSTAKGGRMRVVTGFLRASGRASLTGMPSGPSRGESKTPNSYTYDRPAVEAVLDELELGGTFYFSWSADYAKYREAYDGFLDGAIQNWPSHVAAVVAEVNRRYR